MKRRFSLYNAYAFGAQSVLQNFGLFMLSILVGSFAMALFLMAAGVVDGMVFYDQFAAVVMLLKKMMNNALGAFELGEHTVRHQAVQHLPQAMSRYMSENHVFYVNVFRKIAQDLALPLMLFGAVAKLFADLLAIGWIKIALQVADKKEAHVSDLFVHYRYLVSYVLVSVLQFVAVMAGLLLFVVPGIYLHQRLRFARYFVVDKGLNAFDALKESWAMTQGSVMALVELSAVEMIVSLLGSAVFVLMFLVYPLSWQVEVSVYRQMCAQK